MTYSDILIWAGIIGFDVVASAILLYLFSTKSFAGYWDVRPHIPCNGQLMLFGIWSLFPVLNIALAVGLVLLLTLAVITYISILASYVSTRWPALSNWLDKPIFERKQ